MLVFIVFHRLSFFIECHQNIRYIEIQIQFIQQISAKIERPELKKARMRKKACSQKRKKTDCLLGVRDRNRSPCGRVTGSHCHPDQPAVLQRAEVPHLNTTRHI